MHEILTKLGLDETESKVYLAMLELGPSTVSQITRKAMITRTLGYHVLEKLGWKGLVNRTAGSNKKMIYAAEHPQRLLAYLKNQRSLWDRRLHEAEDKLADFVSLSRLGEKPLVRYQEGAEGLKSIYAESLAAKTEILAITDYEAWAGQEFSKNQRDYLKERCRLKIHERILTIDTPTTRRCIKDWYKNAMKYSHFRFIKPEDISVIDTFWGEVNVFNNKVMMSLHKPGRIGILIESTPLTNLLKSLFEMAWRSGKPYEEKKTNRQKSNI
ncbi:MAG: Transcriptional regulator, TrmB [uncultured bacterium]|nr:MAG: Transcriptional regulator, TrmB [uncultured bacterium]